MIRTAILAAFALLLAPLPVAAQSQDDLDARYDRALAAGYKALFLCSAIANAERNGAGRAPESVMEWELTGIQAPLNEIVPDLPFEIVREESGVVSHVSVAWADDMPPRIAAHRSGGKGCSILPIGMTEDRAAPRNVTYAPSGEARSAIESGSPSSAASTLAAVFDRAFDGTYGDTSRTTAVVVQRGLHSDEPLEASQYSAGFDVHTPQRTWSVAKSIAATLVGAAVHRGHADVTASAGLGLSESDPRRAITIDNALRMATGRYSDTPGNRTDALYFGGATVDEVAVDWPLLNSPVGSRMIDHTYDDEGNFISFDPPMQQDWGVFRYANNDTLAAVQAIEETFADYPPANLFDAIGMHHTVAETDWQGNYILSSQVWSTAPDLLRLGQLYLDDGVLPDGTRVLPEGWVDYVSTPSGPQPEGRNMGYGAGWWLFNNYEGIPADTIAAQGNRGQYVVVVPSRDLVIVRRGEDPAGGSGFDIQAFTADVLAALAE